MKRNKFWATVGKALAIFALAIAVVPAPSAQAQTYSVLYSFKGKHGKNPVAGLIRGKNGTLFGTTVYGGAHNQGTVFRLKADGTERVLYAFTGGADGANPYAGLVRDSAGNLYGTTEYGGAYNQGTVFKLDTIGVETVLHSFNGSDGAYPYAGLMRDKAGNLYGTSVQGGAYGAGVVFKLDTTGAYTLLYSFTGGADGANPYAGLVRDSAGNLYGTTVSGGIYFEGYLWGGVVFKLDTTGAETVLYSFCSLQYCFDGAHPTAGLVLDSAGNLYGTIIDFSGAVFKLDKTGAYTVLHSFVSSDGTNPYAGLVRDSAGNLYGTTEYGGAYGAGGVVFKLDTTGAYTVLYSFTGGADGANPYAGLVQDSAGNLYGTTEYGGNFPDPRRRGCGVVFKITPQ